MAYEDNEDETTILELTYHYGAVKYTKGNAYSQVCSITKLTLPTIFFFTIL